MRRITPFVLAACVTHAAAVEPNISATEDAPRANEQLASDLEFAMNILKDKFRDRDMSPEIKEELEHHFGKAVRILMARTFDGQKVDERIQFNLEQLRDYCVNDIKPHQRLLDVSPSKTWLEAWREGEEDASQGYYPRVDHVDRETGPYCHTGYSFKCEKGPEGRRQFLIFDADDKLESPEVTLENLEMTWSCILDE